MRRTLFTFMLLCIFLAVGFADTNPNQQPQASPKTAGQEPAEKDGADTEVDNDGTVKAQCPRTCSREVRYCTEWLPDGKCKLWDTQTEYYCCPE